jgi:hypothetical protein
LEKDIQSNNINNVNNNIKFLKELLPVIDNKIDRDHISDTLNNINKSIGSNNTDNDISNTDNNLNNEDPIKELDDLVLSSSLPETNKNSGVQFSRTPNIKNLVKNLTKLK